MGSFKYETAAWKKPCLMLHSAINVLVSFLIKITIADYYKLAIQRTFFNINLIFCNFSSDSRKN